jgi:hypothetical protein
MLKSLCGILQGLTISLVSMRHNVLRWPGMTTQGGDAKRKGYSRLDAGLACHAGCNWHSGDGGHLDSRMNLNLASFPSCLSVHTCTIPKGIS